MQTKIILAILVVLSLGGGIFFFTNEKTPAGMRLVRRPANQVSPLTDNPVATTSPSQKPTTAPSPTISKPVVITPVSSAAIVNKQITITYNGVSVEAIVDKPSGTDMDLILAYHGTTMDDSKIVSAAQTMITSVKKVVTRTDAMIVSVAYPEGGLLMGDEMKYAEASVLWAKNNAGKELGVNIKKIFLFGHSRGGYVVTRLNTMHATDGVVANGAGPIDLFYRCGLEDSGAMKNGQTCGLLRKAYGTTLVNPSAYTARSLISFASGYKSKILFVQGMADEKVQLATWPGLKTKIMACTDCAPYTFYEAAGAPHQAVFQDAGAKKAANDFLK